MKEIDTINTFEPLHELLFQIPIPEIAPGDEPDTLSLPAVMYIAERMTRLLLPLIADPSVTEERLLGIVGVYFGHRIVPNHLAYRLEEYLDGFEDLALERKAIALLLLAMAHALACYPSAFVENEIYLNEDEG